MTAQSPLIPSADLKVIRRNQKVTAFDASKISVAMTKAFLAVDGGHAAASAAVHDKVADLTAQVVAALGRRYSGTVHIEDIQDQVELALMRSGEHKVARSYVLYRDQQAQKRAEEAAALEAAAHAAAQQAVVVPTLHVTLDNGDKAPLNQDRMHRLVVEAARGLSGVSVEEIVQAAVRDLYDGIPEGEVSQALMMSARARIEKEPNYTYASARLLLDALRHEALKFLKLPETRPTQDEMAALYPSYLKAYVTKAVELELLAPELLGYDFARLGAALLPERDGRFDFLGLQTLYDRYFIHSNKVRFELPQAFFMRVAMGLALNESGDREARAIEFYQLLSSFDFMSSTPTLFNSGTLRPQLSSCYLTTVPDDLDGIFGAIKDNALLSKFAGGLGNDWTPVRGMSARIKGTNGKSQGVVPFLKVANDTCVAVNQCFAPETLLHTADGLKAIKDVQKGDLVLGISGQYRTVEHKFTYNQREPMRRLQIKHAISAIEVTSGHPFYALTGVPVGQSLERTRKQIASGKRKLAWVDAQDLHVGDYVAQVIPTEVVPVAGFTVEDARLYGVLLGDGHMSADGMEWGVSGNPQKDEHLAFVRAYLEARGIHYWQTARGETYAQVRWASGKGAVRCGTTGRIVGAGAATLPFAYADLYNDQGQKRIARRFAHLPRPQTLALLGGLLETDGCLSRGKEISFTSTSQLLAEGLRYQCLRLGVPTSGQYRERDNAHTATRSDGSQTTFSGITKAYDVRIPATAELAALAHAQPLHKHNWLTVNGMVFSRVRQNQEMAVKPFVMDLIVEGDESYMTTSALAHNGGKRKGAMCAYLETWHRDIEEFLDLRKNTGDDRRRTHDMNTANWVPDLFMERVMEDGPWTLFSPDETPDLHDLYGAAFKKRYTEYEQLAEAGQLKNSKRIPALQLWRKMLSMLFETGHPWITFKDPCNLRSPQQHVGVVHSSNLCCIAADQRVVTDRGMLTVGELFQQGGQNKVVGLTGVNNASEMLLPRPNAPMVKIHTREGYSHKVTPDHKVWVKDAGWVEAQHLKAGDHLLIQQLEGLWGPEHQPELAYVMGLITGDGTFSKQTAHIDVWQHDFPHIESITHCVHTLLDGNSVLRTTSTNTPHFNYTADGKKARLSSAPLQRLLSEQGLQASNKLKVPEMIWKSDKATVSAYLRGLYQADGGIVASGEVTTMFVASISRSFIEELQILWANFGVKSSINQMRDEEWHVLPNGKGGEQPYLAQPLYRLLITSIKGCRIAEEVTQLAAHKASDSAAKFLQNLQKDGYVQKLHCTFSHLEDLPNEDAYCLMVDSETHAWTVNGLITKNTEITLNTRANDEIAVCNLGSVNLPRHIENGVLNLAKLQKTITTAMRMLDNVIEYNYYSVDTARQSNLRHRPVGLGIMGFNDALYKLRLAYESEAAIQFADTSMEAVSYYAIQASAHLALERGAYPSFKGSLWSQGILPLDSIMSVKATRKAGYLQQDDSQSGQFDWEGLRNQIQSTGIRNSNTMAIAPTATIANITGVSQSIEPTYQNLYVKSNLSGDFTVVNEYLVNDLKALNLWDAVMAHDLKYYDGSVQKIERIPLEVREIYKCAFEIDAKRLIDAASRRQKWIDQAQSLNLYMAQPSGKKLDELYKHAWLSGLKTTYYLRSLGATHVEKTTISDTRLNQVGKAPVAPAISAAPSPVPPAPSLSAPILVSPNLSLSATAKACSILDPDCEACQ